MPLYSVSSNAPIVQTYFQSLFPELFGFFFYCVPIILPKANQKLSEARAKVVMDALISKGVNPDNLSYKGFGASKPVASNKTAAGRAQNRRTEVIHVGTVYEGKL